MKSTYKILFKVDILHHFFLNQGQQHFAGMSDQDKLRSLGLYNIHEHLTITPTPECLRKLKGYKLIYKQIPTGFLVASPVSQDDPGKPAQDLTGKDLFSFELQIRDGLWFNYSGLPLNNGSGLFHFHNHNKTSTAFPDLVSIPSAFDSSAASNAQAQGEFAYAPGDLIVDDDITPAVVLQANQSTNSNDPAHWQEIKPAADYDTAQTYEAGAIVHHESGGNHALYKAQGTTTGNAPTDTTHWDQVVDLPQYYAGKQDVIPVGSILFNYEFFAADLDVRFEMTNLLDEVVFSQEATSSSEKLSHTLLLDRLPAGRYHLEVINIADSSSLDAYDFYLPGKRKTRGVFGFIDIVTGHQEGNYSIVQSDNSFNSPTYTLRILNRSTVWRYFNTSDLSTQMHRTPFFPLTESGSIEVIHGGNELPNPSALMIKPEPDQYYSDIYL